MQKNQSHQHSAAHNGETTTIMDECEILDWDYQPATNEPDKLQASGERSSHKSVEMTPNTKTPLYLRDGEFGKFLYACDCFVSLIEVSHL